MIEELLQFLVAEIDTYLLKSIVLKYFKTSNIQDTNKTDPKE